MIPGLPAVEDAELEALEARVQQAFASGDSRGLEVLGFGEISCVLAWSTRSGPVACKRLPALRDGEAFAAYAACFEEQEAALTEAGIPVLETALRSLPGADGTVVVYCVQPRLPRETLGPAILARDAPAGRALLETILTRALGFVSPRRGLDAQISNWAVRDDEASYLDVTTPLIRDEHGRERLDTGLFLASLPWALRGVVRLFLLRRILDTYYTPRLVVRDVLANLIKEGLGEYLEAGVAAANARVDPSLSVDEVRRYYAADARMWTLLQSLRRLDRTWQRRVRRRPYRSLLPGRIERRL